MAIYGALAEAPASSTNPTRKGEMEANGVVVIPATSNGVATITVPYQMRTITNVLLTVNATASSDGVIALVSSISNNTFAIKVFELDGTAADTTTTVNWLAFGKLA